MKNKYIFTVKYDDTAIQYCVASSRHEAISLCEPPYINFKNVEVQQIIQVDYIENYPNNG